MNLFSTLVSLGVHIGHLKQYSFPYNNSFVIGSRYGMDVIDIQHVVLSLRKVTNFLYHVGSLKGDLLFHVSSLHKLNSNIHFFFVYLIVNQYKQRLFDEKWVFGQFGNFREHALSLIYKLFFVQKTKFNLWFSRNHKRTMGFRVPLFKYKRGYYFQRKWLKKNKKFKKHKLLNNMGFIDLFIRVIFYSYFRRIKGISFAFHFSKMVKYFKFVLIFKYFRTFLILPDVFIFSNPEQLTSPVLEMLSYKIPVIGLVDSNTNPFGITYPIYSNDDNILISIFYYKLFLKIYSWGKISKLVQA